MIVEVLQNNGYPLKMIFKGYLTQGSKNFSPRVAHRNLQSNDHIKMKILI